MEYRGKFVHTLVRIQHIALMSRIDPFCETCRLATQTLAPTLPVFQGIKCCVKHIASQRHKNYLYIRLIIIMYQMSSDLHGVVHKLNTTLPKIV